MKATVILLFILLSGQVFAEKRTDKEKYTNKERGYLSLQFGQLALETDRDGLTPKVPTLTAALGWKPWRLIALELRGGAGMGESQTQINLGGEETFVSVQMDYYYSLLLKPHLKLKHINLYLLGGFTEAKFQTSPEFPVQGISEGVSYGVGGGYVNDDAITFNLEYLSLIDADNIRLGGLNFTVEVPLW